MKKRCVWSEKTENEIVYHDQEWGVPVHDDILLAQLAPGQVYIYNYNTIKVSDDKRY